MRRKAFTFIEILLVLIVVGVLTSLSLSGFKRSRDAHRVDSLLQELSILRTAILSYREVYGNLPEIEESALSSNNFNSLKPFWNPFHPESSKVLEGGCWWGKIGANAEDTFLAIKQCGQYFPFEVDLLEKKIQGLCCYDATGAYFYILEPY